MKDIPSKFLNILWTKIEYLPFWALFGHKSQMRRAYSVLQYKKVLIHLNKFYKHFQLVYYISENPRMAKIQ